MAQRNALDELRLVLAAAPPSQFVEQRNALAATWKAKDVAISRAVKALRRPTPAAWALNQLALQHADELRDYLAHADRLRRVQTGKKADDLADAIRKERAARHESVVRATKALATAKVKVTPELKRTIADSLLAAAMGEQRADLERGLLVGDLRPAGLEELDLAAALAVVRKPEPAKPEPAKPEPAKAGGHLRLVKSDVAETKERARRAREEKVAAAAERKAAAAAARREAARTRKTEAAERALEAAEKELRTAQARVAERRIALETLKSERD